MLNFTYAISQDMGALYKNGKLVFCSSEVDLEDLLIYADGEPFKIKRSYLDEHWVTKIVGYILPTDEKDLVLLDD